MSGQPEDFVKSLLVYSIRHARVTARDKGHRSNHDLDLEETALDFGVQELGIYR
jgi:hypothetical protein